MIQMPQWVTTMRQQVDSWAQQQRTALPALNPAGWPPWHWKLKLPWHEDKKRKEELREEYRRRKMQIDYLCEAVKVDNLVELQDVLGAMVLAECAYKKPDAEVLRAMNSFKADFGGQLISLYHVQSCLDHVPHRYILAEGGDTLFAAFAGTKYYRDYITDANFLQGALFHDDEDEADMAEEELEKPEGSGKEVSTLSNVKPKQKAIKPAAHRGFLARAKGIPAVELYRLAQKRDRNLVLCGHSLGGAVAALATLAILRVFATPSVAKSGGRLQVKCITFSQPPVGNPALRDYVHQKGWQHHFRNYCIPEDLIPRILSPAYFQHYRTQASNLIAQVVPVEPAVSSEANKEQGSEFDRKKASDQGSNNAESDHMILGVGPLPKHIWRLPRLVPLVGTPRPFQWFKGRTVDGVMDGSQGSKPELQVEVRQLEIQEDAGSVTLRPSVPVSDVMPKSLRESRDPSLVGKKGDKPESLGETEQVVTPAPEGNKEGQGGNGPDWLKRVPSVSVPSLPSYVPFGELFLLERSSVIPLSASEYTTLTSVQSVIQELKERFRSHTMRSYRARFLRIYDSCMSDNLASTLKMEHLPHLPNLQNWLGILVARIVETGSIAEPIILRTATSLVPLGWTGRPGVKREKPLIIDVHGFGLHLCTLVRARVNGQWCATTLESIPPPAFPQQELQHVQPKLQKMRIQIGPPLNNKSQKKTIFDGGSDEVTAKGLQVANSFESLSGKVELPKAGSKDLGTCEAEALGEVTIECSTDFTTASQDVVARLRRVRLLGLEGAGKTSLYFALLGQGGRTVSSSDGGVLPDMDVREGVANGIKYVDPAGVNLQNLVNETEQLRQEVRLSAGQSGKKLDLIILVHNLAHKIPRLHGGDSVPARPALGILLDEITAAGIPVILAITNKFAVSADRRHLAALSIMNTYEVPSKLTVVVNSCPYSVHGLSNECLDSLVPAVEGRSEKPIANGIVQGAAQLLFGPMKLVPHPFAKREVILPTEGIKKLNSLVQTVLSSNEEAAFEDHAKEHLALQTAEELVQAARVSSRFGVGKSGAAGAAAVGAAFGAGVGVFVAVIVGASKALRKP